MPKEFFPKPDQESEKPKPTYGEQQYLAFLKNLEVPVTRENIKIIATPILKARMEKIQQPPIEEESVYRILDEVCLIEEELADREAKAKKELVSEE